MSVTKAVDQNTDKPEQLDGIIERSDNGANFADTGDIVIAHVCASLKTILLKFQSLNQNAICFKMLKNWIYLSMVKC